MIDGPQSFFPVYEPTQEDLKARLKAAEGPADTKYYDANGEGMSHFSASSKSTGKVINVPNKSADDP
jgi:hypothetical protein